MKYTEAVTATARCRYKIMHIDFLYYVEGSRMRSKIYSPTFFVDHPFVYHIWDKANSQVIALKSQKVKILFEKSDADTYNNNVMKERILK